MKNQARKKVASLCFAQPRLGQLLPLILAALLILFLIPCSASAQVETGRIGGTITDPSGAVIPNARVTVINVSTQAARNLKSDSNGYYLASNLPPGKYSVVVQFPGFKKAEQAVTLGVGGNVSVKVRLAVVSAETSVEVTGTGITQVNTQTAAVSQTITSQDIQQLPSLTRNPYDFVVLSGNVSESDPSAASQRGVGVAINGLRAAGTNVLLDGAANNDEFDGGVGQPVPMDSVQEYTILTNNFGAQYGRADAGIVNVATKSGTNQFHGSAYEYNRVSKLAANNFYNNANGIDKGIFTRNQFGFSVGGPIKKDKLFFFANPEWDRIRSAAPQYFLVPDAAFIAAAAPNTQQFFQTYGARRSDLQTLQVLSRADIAGDPCTGGLAGGPCQSYPMTAPMFDSVTYNTAADAGAGSPENQYLLDSRVDWNISDKSEMYFRFADDHEAYLPGTVNTSPYAGYETNQTISDYNGLISYTRTFSSDIVSQSKIVFNRLSLVQPLGTAPVGPTLYLGNVQVPSYNGVTAVLPGYSETTPGNAIPFGGPQNFYQGYEDMTVVRGTHTFRFGGSYTYLIDNRAFGAYEEAVEALSSEGGGGAFDNLLNGNLFLFESAVNPQGKYPCVDPNNPTPSCTVTLPVGPPDFTRSNRYNEAGLYVVDRWKVRPTVALTLGLRWDYFGVQHNKNPNLDSNYYLGSGSNFFQQYANGNVFIADKSPVGGLWAPDYKDFSPHLGFAWDVFGNGKTSLRGGYSIGYERNFGNVTFNVIQNPPNYAVISLESGETPGPGPITVSNAGPLAGTSGTIGLPTTSLRNVNPHIKTAYAQLYSLTFEHQLSPKAILSIGYSGSKGSRLYSLTNPNRPGSGNVYLGIPCAAQPCLDRLRNTQYSTAYRRNSDGKSLYNAMNIGLTLNNVRNTGLTLTTNYTVSRAMDDLSSTFSDSWYDLNAGYLDPFNPELDWGPAEFDNTQRISLGAIWDIPFHSTRGIANQFLGGWELAPIFTAWTGFPLSVFDCTNAWEACPRAFKASGTAGIAHSGSNVAVPGVPDTFNWINYFTAGGAPLFDSSYVNSITGTSDFGPFPSTMYGRDAFRAPGYWNMNLGFYKNFKIKERYTLQFRAETYNTFNHANESVVVFSNAIPFNDAVQVQKGVANPNSGANLTNVARNIQLALRFTF